MRLLLPLLLLSTAVPALAQPVDDQDQRESRGARFEQRQARMEQPQARFERSAPATARVERIERPQAPSPPQVSGAPVQGSFGRPERRFEGGRPGGFDGGASWRDRRGEQPRPTLPPGVNGAPPAPGGDGVANWRWRDRRDGGQPTATPPSPTGQYGGARDRWQGRDGRRDGGAWTGRDGRRDGGAWTGRTGNDGRQGGYDWRDRRGNAGAWRPDWRRDPRYDWQRYRDRNRAIFRIGAYIDPFGYGYQQVGIGYQLYPNYYTQQYWIGDPGYYSLPQVGWPYQWVRYYNDALLIDVRDGRVVDAIQSFFW